MLKRKTLDICQGDNVVEVDVEQYTLWVVDTL